MCLGHNSFIHRIKLIKDQRSAKVICCDDSGVVSIWGMSSLFDFCYLNLLRDTDPRCGDSAYSVTNMQSDMSNISASNFRLLNVFRYMSFNTVRTVVRSCGVLP